MLNQAVHRSLAVVVSLALLTLSSCSRSRETRDDRPSASAMAAAETRAKTSTLCEAAPDPLIAFSLEGTHGAIFLEQLSVDCSGKLGYVATAPLDGSEIGRFEMRLPAERVREIRELSRELLAAPDFVPSLPPQGADLTVMVYAKPKPVGWVLRPDVSAAHGKAAALRSSLTEQARRAPSAAVGFSAQLTAGKLALVAMHRGDKPLRLVIDEGGVRVLRSGPVPASFATKPAIGFVDAKTKLLDGLVVPAELGGGTRAVLLLDLPEPKPGSDSLRVELTGRLALPEDGDMPPTRTFRVVSGPTGSP